jgi:hypothetical protein
VTQALDCIRALHQRCVGWGHRERHAKKEWSAKARNHPRGASVLPHSEGIAYKLLCSEIAMCSRVGRMGSIK